MRDRAAAWRLTISLFGRLRCRTADAEISMPTRSGARDLFAILALSSRPLQRGRLATALWPDASRESARANLRRHVAYLESWMHEQTGCGTLLARSGDLIALDPDVVERIDVRVFEAAVASGDLTEALTAYSGDLLQDLDGDWIAEDRVRLRALYDEALQMLVTREREREAPETALRYVQSARSIDPYNESWLRIAMRVRFASGDRSGALHEYDSYRAFVERELGVEPMPETFRLWDSIRRSGDVPSPLPLPIEATSFVGRDRELEEVRELASRVRIVCVTGEPGVGKSRFALRFARSLAHEHRDGLIIVDAGASTADGFERALVRAFERAGTNAFGASIEDLAPLVDAVVLIDNGERLAARGDDPARRILQANPALRIIATSRVPLGAPGTAVFRLGPLSQTHAERLFLDRFRLVRPGFGPSGNDAAAVGRICRRLDGVPLAIELAAGRGRAATLGRIERDIGASSTPSGRGALGAAYETSYEFLSLVERTALLRLAAFPSGWTPSMALAACEGLASHEAIVTALDTLVDHSLVVPPAPAETVGRYSMLAPTRDFARARAKDLDSSDRDARAQAIAVARHYGAIGTHLRAERAAEHYAEVERDRENVRAALATLWSGDVHDRELATGLGLALSRFWADQGPAREGADCLNAALEHVGDRDPARRLELLRVLGTLTRDLGDYEASYRNLAALVSLHEREGSSDVELGKSQLLAANAARMTGRYDEALSRIRRGDAAFRASGTAYLAAWAAYSLGTTLLSAARFPEARAALERATHEFNEIGAVSDSSSAIANLSLCHFYEGGLEIAQELALESLHRAKITGHRYYFAHAALNEALILAALGRPAEAWPWVLEAAGIAASLGAADVTMSALDTACSVLATSSNWIDAALVLGAAERARERVRATRLPVEEPAFAHLCSRLRAALGDDRFVALRTRGSLLPVAEALRRLETIEPSRPFESNTG